MKTEGWSATWIQAILVLMAGWSQVLLVLNYPSYVSWDMDHITVLDAILINSNQLPDHFAHPGLGLQIMTAQVLKWLHFFALGPSPLLETLENSLNPVLVVATLTDHLRLFTAFIGVLSAIFLWATLRPFLRVSAWFEPFLFALLLFQVQLGVLGPIIRTETYCLFFFSLHLFFFSRALCFSRSTRENSLQMLAAGIFLGLSFLTKVQSVLFLIFVPIFYFFFRSQSSSSAGGKNQWERLFRLNAVIFAGLTLLCLLFRFPSNIENFRAHHRDPNQFWFALALIFAVVWVRLKTKWGQKKRLLAFFGEREARDLQLLLLGFFASFLTAFLMGLDVGRSWQVFATIVRTVFMGQVIEHVQMGWSFNSQRLLSNLRSVWPLLFVHLLLIGVLAFEFLRSRRPHEKPRSQQALLFGWVLLVFLFFFGVRVAWRQDLIWYEPLLITLFLLTAFHEQVEGSLKRLRLVLVLCLLLFQAYQWTESRWWTSYSERESSRLLTQVYGGHQALYTDLVNRNRGELPALEARSKILRQVRQSRLLLEEARALFRNQKIQADQIGVFEVGFRAWRHSPDERWTLIPAEFQGATLVDPRPQEADLQFLPWLRRMLGLSAERWNLLAPGQGSALSVREDLKVFVLRPKQQNEGQVISSDGTRQTFWALSRLEIGERILSRAEREEGALILFLPE